MEGAWRYNPFFWLGLKRLGHKRLSRRYLWRLNPFNWSKRTVRVVAASFFLIMLPIYLYIGFQPVSSTGALGYPLLEIPTINLETPVATLTLDNHQLVAPDHIAGAYSRNTNKTLIIGHSSTVFQKLEQIETGTTFYYDDHRYVVSGYEILAKSDINMTEIFAAAPVETIIIMTCAGEPLPGHDATHRLIITAVLDD